MDVFNAFKGIADMIRDAVEGAMPRQAVVTRSEGSGVWVRYTPVNADSPEMWFPSSIAGLPAGASGWVHPLAGGKGRFIATAVTVPIPFSAHSGNSGTTLSTTSTSEFSYHTMKTITVPPGSYRVSAVATAPTSRSVNTGEIWMQMRVGGVESAARGGNVGSSFLNLSANQLFPMTVNMDNQAITADDGEVVVEIGIRGGQTAGTTTARMMSVHGTLTRIG